MEEDKEDKRDEIVKDKEKIDDKKMLKMMEEENPVSFVRQCLKEFENLSPELKKSFLDLMERRPALINQFLLTDTPQSLIDSLEGAITTEGIAIAWLLKSIHGSIHGDGKDFNTFFFPNKKEEREKMFVKLVNPSLRENFSLENAYRIVVITEFKFYEFSPETRLALIEALIECAVARKQGGDWCKYLGRMIYERCADFPQDKVIDWITKLANNISSMEFALATIMRNFDDFPSETQGIIFDVLDGKKISEFPIENRIEAIGIVAKDHFKDIPKTKRNRLIQLILKHQEHKESIKNDLIVILASSNS